MDGMLEVPFERRLDAIAGLTHCGTHEPPYTQNILSPIKFNNSLLCSWVFTAPGSFLNQIGVVLKGPPKPRDLDVRLEQPN